MDEELVRKDEIWLVDRCRDGSSELTAFIEYDGAQKETNIRRTYLQGRIGGIPDIYLYLHVRYLDGGGDFFEQASLTSQRMTRVKSQQLSQASAGRQRQAVAALRPEQMRLPNRARRKRGFWVAALMGSGSGNQVRVSGGGSPLRGGAFSARWAAGGWCVYQHPAG